MWGLAPIAGGIKIAVSGIDRSFQTDVFANTVFNAESNFVKDVCLTLKMSLPSLRMPSTLPACNAAQPANPLQFRP